MGTQVSMTTRVLLAISMFSPTVVSTALPDSSLVLQHLTFHSRTPFPPTSDVLLIYLQLQTPIIIASPLFTTHTAPPTTSFSPCDVRVEAEAMVRVHIRSHRHGTLGEVHRWSVSSAARTAEPFASCIILRGTYSIFREM